MWHPVHISSNTFTKVLCLVGIKKSEGGSDIAILLKGVTAVINKML